MDILDKEPIQDIDSVLEIVGELARKSHGKSYIYRGEHKLYDKISSSLYRRYEDIEANGFNIEVVQNEILERAKSYTRYTGETDENEILSLLQHNGGETNLIDFTTDYLIALFFACDGEPDEPGRIILLSDNGTDYDVSEPSHPAHRVVAQKSVFVRPSKGYVEPHDILIVNSQVKRPVLDYLRNNHGISTETVYNDLHGFIRHQRIHQSAYVEFHKGVTVSNRGEHLRAVDCFTRAIDLNAQHVGSYMNRAVAYGNLGNYVAAMRDFESALYLNPESPHIYNSMGITRTKMGNFEAAIQLYNKAIELRPDAIYYCNRGESRVHLGEWDKAREDFAAAKGKNPEHDFTGSFRNDYENVEDFQEKTGLTLPEDLAQLLGG